MIQHKMFSPEIKWPAFMSEMAEYNSHYTQEQLTDPNFIFKELVRNFNVSVVFRHETAENYLAKVIEIGKVNPNSAFIQKHFEDIKQMEGVYSYHLSGGIYDDPDNRPNIPITENFSIMLLAIIWNIYRDHYTMGIKKGLNITYSTKQ